MNIIKPTSGSNEVTRSVNLPRPHPGIVFKRRFINSMTKLSEVSGILSLSEKHLSKFLDGYVRVDVDLARKLESYTNVSANAWLHYQTQYDLFRNS